MISVIMSTERTKNANLAERFQPSLSYIAWDRLKEMFIKKRNHMLNLASYRKDALWEYIDLKIGPDNTVKESTHRQVHSVLHIRLLL